MLYLEVEPDALSFFSLEGDCLEQTRFRMKPTLDFEGNLRHALSEMPNAAEKPRGIRVIVCSPGVAMPLSDFTEEIAPQILQYCCPEHKGRNVFFDMIPEANAVWLFGLSEVYCKTLDDLFGTVYYVSAMAPLARYAMQHTPASERRLLVDCRQEGMDIVAVSGNRLLAANSFRVHSAADAAYYATGIASQNHFDLTADTCMLCGDTECRTPIANILGKLFAHVEHHGGNVPQLLRYLH